MNFSRFLAEAELQGADSTTKKDIQLLSAAALKHIDDVDGKDFVHKVMILADYLAEHCGNEEKAEKFTENLNMYSGALSPYWKTEMLGPIYKALDRGTENGFITFEGPAPNPDYMTAIRISGVAKDYEKGINRPLVRKYDAFALVTDAAMNNCYYKQVSVRKSTNNYASVVDTARDKLYIVSEETTGKPYEIYPDGLQFWPYFTGKLPFNPYILLKKGTPPTNNEKYSDQFIRELQSKFTSKSFIQIINDLGWE